MGKVQYITPTGDTSGASDYTRLAAACVDATNSVVVLSGDYYINQSLTVDNMLLTGVCGYHEKSWPTSSVIGSRIIYTGGSGSGYVVKVRGGSIANLCVNCQWLCRGVLLQRCWYMPVCIEGVFVYKPTQVGIDFVDIWGTRVVGSTTMLGRGVAMRFNRCNQLHVDHIRIGSHYCLRHADGGASDTELWEYECDNGATAAQAYYGADYLTDWPSASDTSVTDATGGYITTPVIDRSALVVGSEQAHRDCDVAGMRFTCPVFEPIYAGEYPTVVTHGEAISFDTPYFEGGYHRDCYFKVHNTNPDPVTGKRYLAESIRFNNIAMQYPTKAANYFVRAVYHSRDVVVEGGHAIWALKDNGAVFCADTGTHYRPAVSHLHTNEALTINDTTTINGAVIIP
jgi:hypothetical protein